MVKITETKTQENLLRSMLEKIIQELDPENKRIFFIGKFISPNPLLPGRNPYHLGLYLKEERKSNKKYLGIFLKTEIKDILEIGGEIYDNPDGTKDMYVHLSDDKMEAIVKKHLNQYAEEHNITEIHLERG